MSELKDLHTKIFELHSGTRPKAKDVMKAVDSYVEKVREQEREKCQKEMYRKAIEELSHE